MKNENNLQKFHNKAIYDYSLREIWPQEVLTESKLLSDEKINSEDFNELPFVTIDGEDAKDFDDAIFCKLIPDGFKLYVAIADVSFYVKENSAIDMEARARATSTYMFRKVLPMLPEKLSNDLCSLKEGVLRKTLIVKINFDKAGNIEKYTFHRSEIKSCARLTYNKVEDFLENKINLNGEEYKESLDSAKILMSKLLERRAERGALDFELDEPYMRFDREGKIQELKNRTRLMSHKLIEEFMLSANICAADFLNKNYSQGIYRVHDYPENYKIDRLSQILKRRNINWEGSIEDVDNLNIFIKNLSKRSDKSILNAVVLQSMQRAEYSTKEIGHFGLKYKKYTHFTSPIRRYPDLIVHRMIIAKLNKLNYEIEDLDDLLMHCSERERSSEFASKQVQQNMLCSYAANFRGQIFDGFITGVKDFGVFVDIPKLYTSGLLHITELPKDNYKYNARDKILSGKRRANTFCLGDKISVGIDYVMELEGKISLFYV